MRPSPAKTQRHRRPLVVGQARQRSTERQQAGIGGAHGLVLIARPRVLAHLAAAIGAPILQKPPVSNAAEPAPERGTTFKPSHPRPCQSKDVLGEIIGESVIATEPPQEAPQGLLVVIDEKRERARRALARLGEQARVPLMRHQRRL